MVVRLCLYAMVLVNRDFRGLVGERLVVKVGHEILVTEGA